MQQCAFKFQWHNSNSTNNYSNCNADISRSNNNSVALNGGLFETANKAATETQKESERERLTEIALANYNVSEGKITSADDLASKIESSLGLKKDADKTTETKLVVKGKDTLWQIDLTTAEVKEYEEEKLKTYKGSYTTLTFKNENTINLKLGEGGVELGAEFPYQKGNTLTMKNSSKYPNGTYTMIKIDSTNSGQYIPQVLMHENGEFAIWSTAVFNENITEEELENNTNVDLLYLQK